MSGVVTFDEAAFLLAFPEFGAYSAANPGALAAVFDLVTALYINNTAFSVVKDLNTRKYLIWLGMAHVLYLRGALLTTDAAAGGSASAGNVGRVSSATEGSVSASLDMGATPNTAAWWMQSQYGAQYWTATAPYRTIRYARAPHACR